MFTAELATARRNVRLNLAELRTAMQAGDLLAVRLWGRCTRAAWYDYRCYQNGAAA
jgi:hypothetical protein